MSNAELCDQLSLIDSFSKFNDIFSTAYPASSNVRLILIYSMEMIWKNSITPYLTDTAITSLEELRKTTRILVQDVRSPVQDLNPRPTEYGTGSVNRNVQ
jgi:hypothetical protein